MLREDITRLVDEVGALCAHVEGSVGLVRSRVAALRAEELADPDVMSALLQFAVSTLIDIRDRARAVDSSPGSLDDASRPAWDAAHPPVSPAPAAPRLPSSPPSQLAPHVAPPLARAIDRPAPPSFPPASAEPNPAKPNPAKLPTKRDEDGGESPPRPRPASPPAPPRGPENQRIANHHTVDWLSPARRR